MDMENTIFHSHQTLETEKFQAAGPEAEPENHFHGFCGMVLLMDWFYVTAKTNKNKNYSPSVACVHKQLSNGQREKIDKGLTDHTDF